MATIDIYKNLLGYDPREQQLQQQKLWAGLYGGAQSPYERMGLGLAQLGGALFGGDTAEQGRAGVLNKILQDVGAQYSPDTPEYFKAIADALPADMTNAKAYALQEARKLDAAATKQTREDVEFISKRPEQLATELEPLTTRLENKAQLLYSKEGYDPNSGEPIPDNIMKKLEKTPEYKKIMQLSNAGQTAIIDREQKERKEALTIESLETTIKKNKADLNKIGNDFDSGTRWNYERQAAIDALAAAGYEPNAKLQGADQLNTALVSAQKVALRQPWTGGKSSVPPAAGGWSATVKPAPVKK
jgi:hypothetical protein